MIEVLALVSSILYILTISVIFFYLFRRNIFWVYFLSIEYFYFIGLGIAPLLMVLGLAGAPMYAFDFSKINFATYFHIICYSVGAAVGFFSFKLSNRISERLINYSVALNINTERAFYILMGMALVGIFSYFYLTGFEKALVGAAHARSGDFDYFEGAEQFAFLKRFIILCVYLVAFVPYFVVSKKHLIGRLLAIGFVGICAYLVTISRYSLLQTIVLPIVILWVYKWRQSVWINLIFAAGFLLSLFVLNYGKAFAPTLAQFVFNGGDLWFNKSTETPFLDQFSHLLFSVDTGIEYFLGHGPLFANDVLLSIFGIIPSALYERMGLSGLSYQFVDEEARFACINTMLIAHESGCFLPPYFVGASAYMFPLVGGFLFGFARFLFYSSISKSWDALRGREKYLPILLLIFLCVDQMMLFIPSTISLTVFLFLIFWILRRMRLLGRSSSIKWLTR